MPSHSLLSPSIVADRAAPGDGTATAPLGLCASLSMAAAGAWAGFGDLMTKAQGSLASGTGAQQDVRSTLALGAYDDVGPIAVSAVKEKLTFSSSIHTSQDLVACFPP